MDSAQSNLASLFVPDDQVQTKINLFVKSLADLGLDQQQVEVLAMNVATTATNQTIAKISSVMDEEDWKKWEAFIKAQPTPNTAQQIIVMNEFLTSRINKDLNAIFNEILEGIMQSTKDGVIESRDLNIKISKLPKDLVDKAQRAVEDSDFEELDKILNSVD